MLAKHDLTSYNWIVKLNFNVSVAVQKYFQTIKIYIVILYAYDDQDIILLIVKIMNIFSLQLGICPFG